MLVRMQTGAATLEGSLAISSNAKHTLPYDPAISLPGKYPHEVKNYFHTELLFLAAKTWKEPRCPSIGELKNKLWYIHTMGYYLMIKNELSSHKRHGIISIAYYEVKEASLKRPYTMPVSHVLQKDRTNRRYIHK